MNIIKPSCSMKSSPSENSSLETECLFGEAVEVLDENLDWVYCKLITDNYYGWVKKNRIAKFMEASHRVLSMRTFVYKEADAKSDILLYLPMGSHLVIDKIISGWAKMYFLVNGIFQMGYVPANHIVEFEHKLPDWVTIAQSLEGTPYKWGGRDTLGIDCSALLQLSYQVYGENIPRNTSEQIKLKKDHIKDIDDIKRGCVIFWQGHVGIMIDKVNCIHANAYHMKTVTEPLIDIINRMGKNHQIIKMMDFN